MNGFFDVHWFGFTIRWKMGIVFKMYVIFGWIKFFSPCSIWKKELIQIGFSVAVKFQFYCMDHFSYIFVYSVIIIFEMVFVIFTLKFSTYEYGNGCIESSAFLLNFSYFNNVDFKKFCRKVLSQLRINPWQYC